MIEIEKLTKKFANFCAVKEVSFNVLPGEILGFLGPNGAGKSTTMKMITGFLTPTSGKVSVFGHDIETEALAAKRLMGYLPEGAPSYGDMSVAQYLKFIAEVRGYRGAELKQRVVDVMAQINISDVAHQKIETLSKGYKRRVGLAQAIMHDPRVLILDEPTDGLDPNQKQQVRELIQNLSKDKIVIISTHILEEVSAVCSRALIIAQGKIVADGTPSELEAKSRYHHAVSVKIKEMAQAQQALGDLDCIESIEQNENAQILTLIPKTGHSIVSSVLDCIRQHEWEVEDIHVEKGRLDEVFRRITQEVA